MALSHSYSAIKQFEDCPLRYYRQRILKDVVDEGGEASRHGERIHKFLEDRLKGADLPQEASHYEPLCQSFIRAAVGGELHVEKELVLTDTLTPTGWWEPDAWLRSKLDILIIRKKQAVVADWKTGKRRPDFFQMQLFAVQVFKHYPDVEECVTSLVWLKDMKMDTQRYPRQISNELWTDIMSRIRRIHDAQDTGNWPARPSGLCRFCPARHNCDYAAI
jgi:hypothetical protein